MTYETVIEKESKAEYQVLCDKTGENPQKCPVCAEDRKKGNQNKKPFSYNSQLQFGHCQNCGISVYVKKENYKSYVRPEWKNETTLPNSLIEWFQSRNIKAETLTKMKVTSDTVWMPQINGKAGAIAFNYFRDGHLINVKYRDRNKNFRLVKDAEKIFYNIDGIKGQKEVWIVEGEIDCLTMVQSGFENTVSVPNGATKSNNKLDYLDSCWTYFENVESVYILTDKDEAGNILADELARRIGLERCYRVNLPEHKDINEVLCNQISVSREYLLSASVRYPLLGVYEAASFWDGLLNIRKNGFPKGWRPRPPFGNHVTIHPGYTSIITGIPGHGKALSLIVKIPTPTGFKLMADIQIGDKVFDEKGKQCNVIATKEWNDRPCFELEFNDGTKIIADENHEWLTDTWKSRRSASNKKRNGAHLLKTKGTDQSKKRSYSEIVTTRQISETVKTKSDNRNNHSIKICGAIEIKKNKLPLHPYLIGCWLGDGRTNYASITCNDIEIIEKIKSLGYKVSKQAEKYQYGLLEIIGKLKVLYLIGNKHIPDQYLFGSKNDRLELLRGLMDTDGSSATDGSCEFTSTNKNLADSVRILVASLGIRVNISTGDAMLNGRFVSKKYRVLFTPSINVFSLKRKSDRLKLRNRLNCRYIISCKPVDNQKTKCIEVDSESHLFLCSESFIPTHNSEHLDQVLIELNIDYDLKGAYFSPENWPTEVHIIKIVEKIVGQSFWDISINEINQIKSWVNERMFWTYPRDGFNLQNVLDHIRKSVLRYGINWYVLDPWNKLDHQYTGPETKYISESLDIISNFNKQNNVHGFLIAHPTKMSKDKETDTYEVPNLYSISGSAHFFNKADLGWTVYKKAQGQTEVHVQKVKQKYWGEVGMINYLWDQKTGRYYTTNPDYKNWVIKNQEMTLEFNEAKYESDTIPF